MAEKLHDFGRRRSFATIMTVDYFVFDPALERAIMTIAADPVFHCGKIAERSARDAELAAADQKIRVTSTAIQIIPQHLELDRCSK